MNGRRGAYCVMVCARLSGTQAEAKIFTHYVITQYVSRFTLHVG